MMIPIHPARRGTLLLFVIIHAILITAVNLLLFAHGVFRPLAAITGGIISGTLITGLVLMAVLVWGVCLRFGRLRPYDIGWIYRHIPSAIVGTFTLWCAAQLIHLFAGLAANHGIAPSPSLTAGDFSGLIGVLVGQLFGNALFEEVAYRGFLFPQLYLRIHGDGERPWLRFALTLFISQALFAIIHIPNRLYLGMSMEQIAADLPMLMCLGVLFTLLYLRTDNLFLIVGIHSLGNTPTTLFATAPALEGTGASLVIYVLAVLGVYAFPLLARAFERTPRQPAVGMAGD